MDKPNTLRAILAEARLETRHTYRIYEQYKKRIAAIVRDPTSYALAVRELAAALKI